MCRPWPLAAQNVPLHTPSSLALHRGQRCCFRGRILPRAPAPRGCRGVWSIPCPEPEHPFGLQTRPSLGIPSWSIPGHSEHPWAPGASPGIQPWGDTGGASSLSLPRWQGQAGSSCRIPGRLAKRRCSVPAGPSGQPAGGGKQMALEHGGVGGKRPQPLPKRGHQGGYRCMAPRKGATGSQDLGENSGKRERGCLEH